MRILVCLLAIAVVSFSAHAQPRVAGVFVGEHPGADAELGALLAEGLAGAGYTVLPLDAETLCQGPRLSASYDLVVLADAGALPARSADAMEAYLRAGGDLVALNAPLWSSPLVHVGGEWTTRDAWRRDHAGDLPAHVALAFAPGEVDGWERAHFPPELTAQRTTVAAGPAPGQRAMKVTIPKMQGWDTTGRAFDASPFPAGHTLTVFSARGGSDTNRISVEWQEADGSRWIAVVGLEEEWRHYVLGPEDFEFWESNPARKGTVFRPENARRLMIGVSLSHSGPVSGPQEFMIGPFGTSPVTPDFESITGEGKVPRLDTLSPGYKYYTCSDVGRLAVDSEQVFVSDRALPLPKVIRASHPRPGGAGFDKGRDWRWIPLLTAYSPDGEWRGHAGTMLCHAKGPYQGGMWASFGVCDGAWYRGDAFQAIFRELVARMNDRLVLLDGGANHYTYFADQDVVLGANTADLGSAEETPSMVQTQVLAPGTLGDGHIATMAIQRVTPGEVHRSAAPLTPRMAAEDGKVPPLPKRTRENPGAPDEVWQAPTQTVETVLKRGDKVIDRVRHDIHLWLPREEKHFITAANGEFRLDGARWRPHGVNFMPSSGVATEDQWYFEYYVGARSYDPRIYDRDLAHVVDMGFNAVSIFIHRPSLEAQNMLDLLRRADALGLKVNLSLRPGTPMNFDWDTMREMIEAHRLWEHDEVFALDLAWEPMFDPQDKVDTRGEWEAWVKDRYGSIANAEADWGCSIARDGNGVVQAPEECHRPDPKEEKLVVAYRRFMDTIVNERYAAARELVKSVDPHHAVSFRQTIAGDPTAMWPPRVPFDFHALGGAVDVLEPEGYGRIGDWEKVKPGFFTHAYARWANPDLPMIWAEAGLHAWDMSAMDNTPDLLERQARFFEDFYRMMVESGSDGVFWWWYPGGFRANENSDYGVINADGTDRPVTKVIREWGPRLVNGPDAKAPDTWIEINRDVHGDGLHGIYEEVEDAYWEAIAAGKTPGLRTPGTGTTSADCPLVAVGGNPCNGKNPPMYLDARMVVHENDRAMDFQTIRHRVTLTNTGEATWLPKEGGVDGKGWVRLALQQGDEIIAVGHIADRVPRHGSTEVSLVFPTEDLREGHYTLSLEAVGRVQFGPKEHLDVEKAAAGEMEGTGR